MYAGAGTAARLGRAAASATYANQARALVQLPRGNRSGAQSRHYGYRKECGFDFLAHGRPPFCSRLNDKLADQFFCGCGGLTGPGSLTHPPVVPLRISQRQPPKQGLDALHVPRQAGSMLAFFCN